MLLIPMAFPIGAIQYLEVNEDKYEIIFLVFADNFFSW